MSFFDRKIVTSDTGEETYLTWKETIGYALGKGGQGMSTAIMSSTYVNYFMTNIFSIPTAVASRIRLFCGLWDAINDPILGVMVDKTRTKYGKMRPYIKWAPFISALFTLMFFLGQSSWNYGVKLVFMIVAYVGWDMAYTAVDVPIGALAFSITPNGIERTKLFGVSAITRAVLGALAGGIVPVALMVPYFKENTAPAYTVSAIVACAGMIIFTRPAFYWTKERAPYSEDVPGVGESVKLLIQNKPLLMLVISNILFTLATLPAAVRMYFAVDLMGDSKFTLPLEIAAAPAPFLAGILVPIIAEKMGKRMDFKKFYMRCCVLAAAVHLLLFATTRGALLGGEGTAGWGLAILIIVQLALTLIPLEFKNLCSKEMEAQTVDYIGHKTGHRAEGVMLSVISFTGKLQNSASSAVALWLLAVSGYATHTDAIPAPQTDSARFALFAMFTLIPAAAWLLMLIPMKFYNTKLDGDNNITAEAPPTALAEREAELERQVQG
ncbi:MAG: MFS transporter [Oscillospiraceae bacterium]|jgi:Na+/melibiose symporter-like transporter|nr:MFS transporter [Oscillospiraceae bacterium]